MHCIETFHDKMCDISKKIGVDFPYIYGKAYYDYYL